MFLYAVEFLLAALVIMILISQVIAPVIFRLPIFPMFRSTTRVADREVRKLEEERLRVANEMEVARLRRELEQLKAAQSAKNKDETV